MQLSKFTDYAFRALMYLATHTEKLCTVDEIAKSLDISEHHLKKIINKLAKTEYVISIKGRNGGLQLGKKPSEINLGDVLKVTEYNLKIVECFENSKQCSLFTNNQCKLKNIIASSLEKFSLEFSSYTLADII
ncbi:MAG: RrF2 family transcriptional regulator [Sarcina sp.]